MTDNNRPHDPEQRLEDQLRSTGERVNYPAMGDSAAAARARIEQSGLRHTRARVASPEAPVDRDGDEDEDIQSGGIVPFPQAEPESRTRRAVRVIAAALAILIVGTALVVLIPNIAGDGEPAAGVLGPDTTGYRLAGTLGGSIIPNEPVSVALDSNGNIYAADIATRSVHKFSPEGEHLDSFTAEDSALDAFIRPWDIAIQDDRLYVLDQQRVAIYLMSLTGDVSDVWQIGSPEDPSDLISGMDVDGDGNVYVTRTNDLIVGVFADGELVQEIVVSEDPATGGDRPADVAVATDGTIYVTGIGGESITAFDREGIQTAQWIDLQIATQFQGGLYGITVAPSGDIYANSEAGVIQIATDGSVHRRWEIETTAEYIRSAPNGSIAVDEHGTIYFPDPSSHRIVSLSVSNEVLLEITDSRVDRLTFPGGLHVNDNLIYVAEIIKQEVVSFNHDGVFNDVRSWSTQTTIAPQPGQVSSLTTSDGVLYVLDGAHGSIVKQAMDGLTLAEWTGAMVGDDVWVRPKSIHLHPNGTVLVLDDRTGMILQYSDEGEFLDVWSERSTGTERSLAIAMDISSGSVFVSYAQGSQPGIWKLDLDGNAVNRVVAIERDGDGLLETVTSGLDVASTGDIFAVDLFSRSVHWFSPDGRQRGEWSIDAGYEAANAFLDIAIDERGTIYVSDSDTRQILVYEPVN